MRKELPVEELEDIAEVNVGEALRRTRLYYDKTLDDVEVTLRIRSCQIKAIEEGDMAALPGRVYAIGFVRSYADYLGIDADKVVQLFKTQYMDGQSNSVLSFPMPASESQVPAFWLVAVSLIVFSASFLIWKNIKANSSAHPMIITNVPQDIKRHLERDVLVGSAEIPAIDPITQSATAPEVVENMSSESKQAQNGIILNIIKSSWVEIKNAEGEVVVSEVLEAGNEYFVPDSPGLSMSLGNAANIEIIVDGRSLRPLGNDGDVRRDIPLDTAYLKTLAFQKDKSEPQEDIVVE